MNCEKIMEKFLSCDNGDRVPLAVRFHILYCKKCREDIFALKNNIDSLKTMTAYAIPFDISDIVMHRIELLEIDYEYHVSNTKWVIAGAVIFFSIILLSYSDWASWLNEHSDGVFDIVFHLGFGLTLTAYVSLFIGTHIKYLIKQKERFSSYAALRHEKI